MGREPCDRPLARRRSWPQLLSQIVVIALVAANLTALAPAPASAAALPLLTADTGPLTDAPTASTGWGDIPARLDEGASGSYTQAIPLSLPSYFTLTPSLSLAYDSQAGDGWLGTGWSLKGLSTLTREGRQGAAVRSGSQEQYLIDGQRLFRCPTSGPGACRGAPAGRAYYLEPAGPDQVTRDISGTTWTRTTTSGTRIVYSPLVRAGGEAASNILSWAPTSITDVLGHRVALTYAPPATGASSETSYPRSIAYGDVIVRFSWEPRPEVSSHGLGSTIEYLTQRLRSIDIQVSGARNDAYAFAYSEPDASFNSTLQSVMRFGRDATVDAEGRVSGPSHELLGHFGLEANGTGWTPPVTVPVPADLTPSAHPRVSKAKRYISVSGRDLRRQQQWVMTDLNGDGQSDLVGTAWDPRCSLTPGSDTPDQAFLVVQPVFGSVPTRSTCTGAMWPFEALGTSFYKLLAGDLDGDGLGDVLLVKHGQPGTGNPTAVYPMLSRGDGTFLQEPSLAVPEVPFDAAHQWQLADVDGDGRDDLVAIWPRLFPGRTSQTSAITVGHSQGAAGFHFTTVDTGWVDRTSDGPAWFVGDLNHDARADVRRVIPAAATQTIPYPHPVVLRATARKDGVYAAVPGSLALAVPWSTFDYPVEKWQQDEAADTVQGGDFNGDGWTDLAFFGALDGHLVATTVLTDPAGGPPTVGPRASLTDVSDRFSNFHLFRSHPDASVSRFPNHWFIGDFNGDGRSDVGVAAPADLTNPTSPTELVEIVADAQGQLAGTDPTTTDWVHDCWEPRQGGPQACEADDQDFYLSGDANADGQTDLMFVGYHRDPQQYLEIGFGLSRSVGADLASWRFLDANGDGLDDLVHLATPQGGLDVTTYVAQPDGTYGPPVTSAFDGPGPRPPTRGWVTGDYDADGRADLARVSSTPYITPDGEVLTQLELRLLLATGDGRWTLRTQSVSLYRPGGSDTAVYTPTGATRAVNLLHWLPGDVDGDGRTDLVAVRPVHTTEGAVQSIVVSTALSRVAPPPLGPTGDGHDWQFSSSTRTDDPLPDTTRWDLADLDGDHLADLTRLVRHGTRTGVESYFAGPDRLDDGPLSWTHAHASLTGEPANRASWRIVDSNGDGRSDLAHLDVIGGIVFATTYLGRGDGDFTTQGAARLPPDQNHPEAAADVMGWRVADANSDGRQDLIHLHAGEQGLALDRFLGQGGRLLPTTEPLPTTLPASPGWSDHPGSARDALVHLQLDPRGASVATLTAQTTAVSLGRTVNATGATTTITYGTPDRHRPNPATACALPVGPSPRVVQMISIADGLPGTAVDRRDYRYACPGWSWARGTLLGYRSSSVSESTGTHDAHPYTASLVTTAYRLTDRCRAQPTRVELRFGDDPDEPVERAVVDADYTDTGTAAPNCLLKQRTRSLCTTQACAAESTSYTYDAYLNVTDERVSDPFRDDTRRTHTDFATPEAGRYLVDLPRRTTVGSGPDLTSATYCYDGETPSPGCARPPVRGQLTASVRPAPGDGHAITGTLDYFPSGQLHQTVDPLGHTTAYTYPSVHTASPDSVCSAQQCVRSTYDPVTGDVLTVTDPNQATTRHTYDSLGQLRSTTDPAGVTSRIDYADIGVPGQQRITTSVDDGTPDGLWSTTWLDGLGRPVRRQREDVRGPDEQLLRYDGLLAAPVAVSHWYRPQQGQPVWDRFGYDGLDRLVSQTHPDGSEATWTYAVSDHRAGLTSRDEVGHRRRLSFDSYDELVSTTEPSTSSAVPLQAPGASYAYDTVGRLIDAIDQAGNHTTNRWSSLGLETTWDADRGRRTYTYNDDGSLRATTDARGLSAQYTYDDLGRLSTRTRRVGDDQDTASWHYDEPDHGASVGRLTSISDPSARGCPAGHSLDVSYDADGEVTRRTDCVLGTSATVDLGYAYDRPVRITYPDRRTVTTAYDAAGNAASATGIVDDAHYDAGGRPVAVAYANQARQTTSYDDRRDWITDLRVSTGSTLDFQVAYTHDTSGDVSTSSSTTNKMNSSYAYDSADRLQAVTGDSSSRYHYDDAGNLDSQTPLGAYTYPRQGPEGCGPQAPCPHPHAVTTVGRAQYRYDGAGNMTYRGGHTLTWGTADKPVAADPPGPTRNQPPLAALPRERWTYNALDTLVAYRATTASGVQLEGRRYPGPYVEQDTIRATPAVTNNNYYFNGDLVARDDGGPTVWLHKDALGTDRAVTDARGRTTARHDTSPFGSPTSNQPGSPASDYLGVPRTGSLTMLGARAYDAQLGRFVSPDTIDPNPTEPLSLDRYHYGLNNPVRYIDPTGHEEEDPAPGIDAGDPDSRTGTQGASYTQDGIPVLVICKICADQQTAPPKPPTPPPPSSPEPPAATLDASDGAGAQQLAQAFAGAFVGSAVRAATTTFALGVISGALPPVGFAVGVYLAGRGAYDAITFLRAGGAQQLAQLGSRVVNGRGTRADFATLGAVLGGVAAGGFGRQLSQAGSRLGAQAAVLARTGRTAGALLAEAQVAVDTVHHVETHPKAISMRVTAALVAKDEEGNLVTVCGSGSNCDLSRAQQSTATANGWLSAKLPKAHAEDTVLHYAVRNNLDPILLTTNQDACPVCQINLPYSGARMMADQRTWIWPWGW